MKAKLVATFPGSGATFVTQHTTFKALDLDPGLFKYYYTNNPHEMIKGDDGRPLLNDSFPSNVATYIRNKINEYEYIFIPTHNVILNELIKYHVEFTTVYPEVTLRDEWLLRIQGQGPDGVITSKVVGQHWYKWIDYCDELPGKKCKLTSGTYLMDLIIGGII